MAYVITIYDAKNQFLGFVHAPRRNHPNPVFRTTQLCKAQKLPTRDEAHRKAMRFNSMNEHKGEAAHVVPFDIAEKQ